MESTIAGDGCFQSYKTPQSSTVWYNGIWNNNEYGIRHGSNGLWIYDTGNTTINGNLDVDKTLNLSRSSTSDTPPLNITNSSTSGWFSGMYDSVPNEVVCFLI